MKREAIETERYELNWLGKRDARRAAVEPSDKVLRPRVERSSHWSSTKNLYIEGDNLDALKLLLESRRRAIKMIYIDPPYNTGHEFTYRDKSAPHSEWCSMIYPRLRLARELLSDDGSIFVSIDDNEQANLKLICDEIFGERNFIAQLNVKRSGARQDSKFFAVVHEYVLCYAREASSFVAGARIKADENYPRFDPLERRRYKIRLLRKWGANSRREDRPNLFYPIEAPDGSELYPMRASNVEGCWRWSRSKMSAAIEDGRVEFVRKRGEWIAYEKIFEPEAAATQKFTTWLDDVGGGGASTLKEIFDGAVFSYPKSVELIRRLIEMANVRDDEIVLDFYSGSATTAHAVMSLNAFDGGSRRFIMIQLPEPCPPDSEAFRAGFETICSLGEERIRRAAKLFPSVDGGFRVFSIETSTSRCTNS